MLEIRIVRDSGATLELLPYILLPQKQTFKMEEGFTVI